jgi:PAS domain S-box-containing protein
MGVNPMNEIMNRRVLVIDDNQAIHDDFRKILCNRSAGTQSLAEAEAALFGDVADAASAADFKIDSAFQGAAGLAYVQHALSAGRPYAMAFIDVRMPPGLDGIETAERIWKVDPDLQIVICTAYSDYSWSEVIAKVGPSDRLVVLKKPFDNIEVSQLALALTNKWSLARQVRCKMDELEEMVRERTAELTATNESLRTEIAERKEFERALVRERDLLQALMDHVPDFIYFKDTASRFTRMNLYHARHVGLKNPAEAIGRKDADLFPSSRFARQSLVDEQLLMTTGHPLVNQVEEIQTHMGPIWASTTKVPLHDPDGKITGLVGISRDITQQKHAEDALAETSYMLEILLKNSPDAIYFKDLESRFVRCSSAFLSLFQVSDIGQVIGKTDLDFFSAEHALAAGEDEHEIIRSGQPITGKLEKETHRDGRVTWALTTKMPWRTKDGQIIGTFGISKDVTALKAAEQQTLTGTEGWNGKPAGKIPN